MKAYYINSNDMVSISGPLLISIKFFLTNRLQRVVLNGQTINWKKINHTEDWELQPWTKINGK